MYLGILLVVLQLAPLSWNYEIPGHKIIDGKRVPIILVVDDVTGETKEKPAGAASQPSPQPRFGNGGGSSTQAQFSTQPHSPTTAQAKTYDIMDEYRNSEYGQFATRVADGTLDVKGFEKIFSGFSGAGGGDEASRTSDYYKKVNEGGGIAALFGGGDDTENAATEEADNKIPSTLLTIASRIEIPLYEDKGDLFAPMMVGSPKDRSKPQEIKALLDTGSHHTWVASSEYRGDHKCKKTDGQQSSTYSTKRIKAEQTFVAGSLKGFWSRDKIVLGSGRKTVLVPSQQYAEATEINEESILSKYDAIYGLSIMDKEVLPKEPSSNLANLAKYYGKVPLFGVFMNKENRKDSKLVFSDNHNYLIEGEFKSYPVQPNMQINGKKYISGWHIKFDRFSVQHNGKPAEPIEPPENYLAFPDSGTSTLAAPSEYVAKLYKSVFSSLDFQIPGPNYEFDCSKMPDLVMNLPPINVVLGGTNYPIKAQDYLGTMGDVCRGFIIGVDNCKDILLGRTFMSNYYTVYDYSNKLVHIGKAKQPSAQAMRMM